MVCEYEAPVPLTVFDVAVLNAASVASSMRYSLASVTAGHVTLYVVPTVAVAGALICGTAGVLQMGAAFTLIVAVAVAPPDDAGSEAVMVALPADSVVTCTGTEWLPAAMVIDAGTVATAVLEELSETCVSATRRWLVSANINPFVPAVTLCDPGVSASVGTGIVMAPLVRVRPFPCVSVVVPPWLLSC